MEVYQSIVIPHYIKQKDGTFKVNKSYLDYLKKQAEAGAERLKLETKKGESYGEIFR